VTAADWTIVIHPSLIITNTLPCTVEIQLTQPVPQPAAAPPVAATADATSTAQHAITAARAATVVQLPVQRKQRARDPGLDLFFLPETMQPASSSSIHHVNGSNSSTSVSGTGIGNSSSNSSGVNSSSRTARAAAAAAASAQAAAVLQAWDSYRNEQQKQQCDTVRVVWQCVLETGKEGIAGALTAGQPLWLRMRVAASGGGAVWSQPLVITAAAIASRYVAAYKCS
jgi:hypothetical protein